jgi:hypothetical protein
MSSRLHVPALCRPAAALPPTGVRRWLADALSDRPRSFFRLLIENLIAALLVLSVGHPVRPSARPAVAFALVAYSVRFTSTQHRQQKELRVREKAENSLREARDQLTHSLQDVRLRATELNQLTELGQLLQSCLIESEAYLLIAAALARLLPECSGALYAMSSISHRAELISEWGNNPPVEKIFEPTQCWAVRRGRAHNGNRSSSPIACSHIKPSECAAALCIPLTTQGEIFGILVLLRQPSQVAARRRCAPQRLSQNPPHGWRRC